MASKAGAMILVLTLLIIIISSVIIIPEILSHIAANTSGETPLLYSFLENGIVIFIILVIGLTIGALVGDTNV